MSFEIQDGISIPTKSYNRASKYPFSKMAVGQSFFVPQVLNEETGELTPPSDGGIRASAKKYDAKFSIRKVTENGVDGWRCWRGETKAAE